LLVDGCLLIDFRTTINYQPSTKNEQSNYIFSTFRKWKNHFGKTLFTVFPQLQFSISATTRALRGEEIHGKDYFFLSVEEFKKLISEDAFVEFEEVYHDKFYGTLKSEVERTWSEGKVVIFDVDVVGGVNLKKIFGEKALSILLHRLQLKNWNED
jgi:guanylate kinase